MFKYAQIDETGKCVSLSFLTSMIDAPNMLSIKPDDDVLPGDLFEEGGWTRPDPEPPSQPEPTPEQVKIA